MSVEYFRSAVPAVVSAYRVPFKAVVIQFLTYQTSIYCKLDVAYSYPLLPRLIIMGISFSEEVYTCDYLLHTSKAGLIVI